MRVAKTKPPAHLSASSKRLWSALTRDFELDDAAGQSLLVAACEAYDRAQQAREVIAREGMFTLDRFEQPKPHPAIAVERDSRDAFVRAMRALKLDPGAAR